MRRLKVAVLSALVMALYDGSLGNAAELPVWEVGLGVGGLSLPSYRGSEDRRGYVLPLPYVVYRGDKLRVDREGVRGGLFRSQRLRLDMSLGAGPPAKSNDGARQEMPAIDPTFEVGPALEVLLDADPRNNHWAIVLPLRTVVATDFRHAQSLGWLFSPYLRYQAFPESELTFDVSVGPIYAAERYHDYYYEVTPEFATAARPAYDARAGYSGSRITLSASKQFKNFWAGVFVRYDDLSGAVFVDSPIVQTHHAFMIGGGISWIFARSIETASAAP